MAAPRSDEAPSPGLAGPGSRPLWLAWLACWLSVGASRAAADTAAPPQSEDHVLPEVSVRGVPMPPSPGLQQRGKRALGARRQRSDDTASLLEDVPGVQLHEAGGLARLPSMRGMADDRLRIQVDGADLMAACPNHMNSALSYIAPASVSLIRVHEGVTPVSVGGDSLGGTIEVESAPARFTDAGDPPEMSGEVGSFYRSNGQARGGHLHIERASAPLWLRYAAETARSGNLRAARGFKPAERGSEFGRVIPADEVASSAYHFLNQSAQMGLRHEGHVLRLDLTQQRVFFEGFPNQRMDMTGNHNAVANLRYEGVLAETEVQASAYRQYTRHKMDMGPDRYQYGTGMPMDSRAHTSGGKLMATWDLGAAGHRARAGADGQTYTLFDWWPAVGGAMGPNAFWNVDRGQRHKLGAFAEWDAQWHDDWFTQLGLRRTVVWSDAAAVQGYDNGLVTTWGADAAAFNRRSHRHTDRLWDATGVVRWRVLPQQVLELGLARKSRAPSVYQRYPWSTQAMAALMNNTVGDGNGYIGNEALRPEVAHTLSLGSTWSRAGERPWSLRAQAHITEVHDHIDARRCDFGQCSADNATRKNAYVLLQYTNESARLYGMSLSGNAVLQAHGPLGKLSLQAALEKLHGENRSTGDGLYHIMPLNLRGALMAEAGAWTHVLELKWVDAKTRVSEVRNETTTASHTLVNLRTRRAWAQASIELGIDNLFNRAHTPPLSGAYVGQGPSMTTQGIPWGTSLPGPGRSIHLALTLQH